jgi:AraC-like DNA-binding protein
MLTAQPVVATVMDPDERARVDAAVQGRARPLHAETLPEAMRAVRERAAQAVLVSPRRVSREQASGVATLIRRFPAVPTVAVVSRHDAASSEHLLYLGASGVRRVVDLTVRDGWAELRDLVAHPSSPTAARILSRVIPALADPTPDSRRFFETMIRTAPGTPSVRTLAKHLHVPPTTVMSRFFRAGLVSPKRYLAATRLLYTAQLLEMDGLSVGDVAYRLEYSSPQSLGRHLRAVVGVTAGEFRRRYPFATALEDYVNHMIVPFRATFRTFHPLEPWGGGPWTTVVKGVREGTTVRGP